MVLRGHFVYVEALVVREPVQVLLKPVLKRNCCVEWLLLSIV